ncbi:hypothetical protein M0R72_20765 [Candidatus Pacearchaeota archaeon]|jgi:hypothetical protein|nr:hypothetical protein [Candidatus Pacearchaeota archaeon]
MAKGEISLILTAKNMLARGLSSAYSSLQKFGKSALRIGSFFAKGFLAAGAALAGFAVKGLSAYAEQEVATNALKSALKSYGDEVENNAAAAQRHASAIQDETGAADESTIANMARLRMLGVEVGALDKAAKGVIALRSAGMAEEAAIKAVALAHAGEFAMLQRYLPELKTATSEAQKAAVVNDFLTKGYQQQKDALNTVGGQWKALKGRVGDVWEEVGAAIAQNETLKNGLADASDAVAKFGARIAEWAKGQDIAIWADTFKRFFETLGYGFSRVKNGVEIFVAVTRDNVETVGTYIANVFGTLLEGIVNQWRTAGDVIGKTISFIKNPSKQAFKDIGSASVDAAKAIKDSFVNTAKAIATNTGIQSDRTTDALADLTRIEQEHAANVAKIDSDLQDSLWGNNKDRVDGSKKTLEEIAIAEQSNAAKLKAISDEKLKLQEGITKAQKEASVKSAEEEIKALEDAESKRREIADSTVSAYLDQIRSKKQADKQWERDQLKAERLRGRGGSAGEFVQAVDAIKAARGAGGQMDQALGDARSRLEALNADGNKTLNDMLGELKTISAEQARLLSMG